MWVLQGTAQCWLKSEISCSICNLQMPKGGGDNKIYNKKNEAVPLQKQYLELCWFDFYSSKALLKARIQAVFIYSNSRDRWHQSARGPVNSSTVILAGYMILTVQIHVLPKVSCRWQAHHSRRRSADLIWERLRQRTPRGTTAWHLKPVGTAVWNWICFVYYVSFPYLKLLLLFSNNWRMAQPILLILVVVIVVFLL